MDYAEPFKPSLNSKQCTYVTATAPKREGFVKRVILVRHGKATIPTNPSLNEVRNNFWELVRLSPVITDEGKQQAAECTQIIARFGVIDCYYASAQQRARESLNRIIYELKKQNTDANHDPSKAPIVFLKCLESKFRTLRKITDHPLAVEVIHQRAQEAWNHILQGQGCNVVVVSHNSIIQAMLLAVLNAPKQLFRVFPQKNTGVTVVSIFSPRYAILEHVNVSKHPLGPITSDFFSPRCYSSSSSIVMNLVLLRPMEKLHPGHTFAELFTYLLHNGSNSSGLLCLHNSPLSRLYFEKIGGLVEVAPSFKLFTCYESFFVELSKATPDTKRHGSECSAASTIFVVVDEESLMNELVKKLIFPDTPADEQGDCYRFAFHEGSFSLLQMLEGQGAPYHICCLNDTSQLY